MRLNARAVIGLLLGASLVLAFQPYEFWPVAFLFVCGFILLTRGQPLGRAALVGLFVGVGFFAPFLPWVGAEVGPIPWLLLALVQAAFFAPLGAALALVQRLPGWPVWAAAAFVAQEALRGRVPYGGFTWGKLAFGQVSGPLMDLAAIGGSVLVSFAVALIGGLLASVVIHRSSARRWGPALLAAAAVLVAGVVAQPPAPDGRTLTVGVVQGNVPRAGLGFNGERRAILENHVEATRQLAADVEAGRVKQPDVVVWPENSSDINPFADPEARVAIHNATVAVGAPVLVGTLVPTPDQQNIENTSVLWDPETGPGETYVKRHPMPFGEYIPMRNLARLVTDAVEQQPRDFVPGESVGVFDVGLAQIGSVICFEVAFDNLVRDAVRAGGEILTVQTNNATFGFTPMSEQQLAMARLRAVEHGRSVVVAALSGISAVIGPDGSVRQSTDLYEQQTLVADVAASDRSTVATAVGEWPEWILVALALASLGLGWHRSRETENVPSESGVRTEMMSA